MPSKWASGGITGSRADQRKCGSPPSGGELNDAVGRAWFSRASGTMKPRSTRRHHNQRPQAGARGRQGLAQASWTAVLGRTGAGWYSMRSTGRFHTALTVLQGSGNRNHAPSSGRTHAGNRAPRIPAQVGSVPPARPRLLRPQLEGGTTGWVKEGSPGPLGRHMLRDDSEQLPGVRCARRKQQRDVDGRKGLGMACSTPAPYPACRRSVTPSSSAETTRVPQSPTPARGGRQSHVAPLPSVSLGLAPGLLRPLPAGSMSLQGAAAFKPDSAEIRHPCGEQRASPRVRGSLLRPAQPPRCGQRTPPR